MSTHDLTKKTNDLKAWCLANNSPAFLDEWDYEKNGDATPDNTSYGSTKKIWWKCNKGHEWQVPVNTRTSFNTGCPYCSGRYAIPGINDLATTSPELAAEWNYEKNNIKPNEIMGRSGKKVWWCCPLGHEYEAIVCDRVKGNGCPYCAGKRILEGFNDLATRCPDILQDWDYEKNDFSPTKITSRTHKKAWWKCKKCGFSWQATIASRTGEKGVGCPQCAIEKHLINHQEAVLEHRGSLQETHVDILTEWDYTKNTVKPTQITAGSNKKVWWLCPKGHSYCQRASHRIKGIGCPVCAREQSSSFPEQAVLYYVKEYFPDVVNGDRTQIRPYELDIYIPSKRTAIEYDGMPWHKEIDKDLKKNELCKKANIDLIRIRDSKCPSIEGKQYICDFGDYAKLGNIIADILFRLGANVKNVDIEKDTPDILAAYLFKAHQNSIATKYPELLCEWNYERNGSLDPQTLSYGSSRKVWWKCSKGHEWQAPVSNMRTTGCPYCANQKILDGYNDLASQYPELLKEWDYQKNNKIGLDPQKIAPKIGKKAWWLCPKGHSYFTVIENRTRGISGCPYCSNRKALPGFNDHTISHPNIVKEWDHEKNGNLKPENCVAGTHTKAWWICSKKHSYQATIVNRTSKGGGCPICAGKQVLPGYNDLASRHPELLKEWDYPKNSELGIEPTKITSTSSKKVWWKCSLGHEWLVAPSDRVISHTGCPYCANKKVLIGFNDLKAKYPDIAKEWDYKKNSDLKPQNIVSGTSKKAWWICPNGHSYQSRVCCRTKRGSGCPYCAKKALLPGFNDFATCHPDLAKEWDYEKNGDLRPTDCIGGIMKVWWKCSKGHSFFLDMNSRTSGQKGCPTCAKLQKRQSK